ncbi:MAG: bifunctional serine/threonine-protein kinase/universal stress protein [Pseudolabrys sp.]
MAKPLHDPGVEIDGFRLEEMMHRGGMATLWRVSKPGIDGPMLMKVPRIGEGADPAAIVSFEMELMILPKLNGEHVPRFIAAGDFAHQPYLVMEAIPSVSLVKRLSSLPLPYDEVARLGVKIAEALDDLHRQHVVHLDIKPSNILFRPDGEAVLIDFGLSHHDQLPDLMQEEFRVPFGTAPYMSPEQLRGIRNDPRSDLFALGVLLYFFSTGERPFGESETMRGMRRRLWRDPMPPRALRPDYPPWLQEIVLRCLETEPGRRHPTATQLAFDLSHPADVKLTARSEKLTRDPFTTVMRRRFNTDLTASRRTPLAAQLSSAPIVAVAVDVGEDAAPINAALLEVTARMLATLPQARLACLNILKSNTIALDTTLDAQGHNKKIDRLVRLKAWAAPLKLDERRLTAHVLEASDPAAAILDFVGANSVDHVLIGARQDSFRRRVLGSVSAKVATEAPCSVTIVRVSRPS